jgi:hypothetical protein
MRVLNAPCEKVPVRSIDREWRRAALSSRASALSGRSPCAMRTWFMTASSDDSDFVRVAVTAAWADPANIKAVTTAATPVRTRLATSGGYESTDCRWKVERNCTNMTRKTEKLRQERILP